MEGKKQKVSNIKDIFLTSLALPINIKKEKL